MNDREAEQLIITNVAITPQIVTIAKAFIVKRSIDVISWQSSASLVMEFLRANDAEMPEQIILHPSVDPLPSLKRAYKAISWQLAACEAIFGLIHSGILLPQLAGHSAIRPTVGWTTVVARGGGHSGGWNFDQFSVEIPSSVRLAMSQRANPNLSLSDDDLFIHEIGIPDIHPDMEEALRDAVDCFRHDLYTPCLAMLTKAAEGAWIELGVSLANALPAEAKSKTDKATKELLNPHFAFAKKIDVVLELYSRQDLLKPVTDLCRIDNQMLRGASIWAHDVRESRNVLHYGVQPPTKNTYEKVAALMIGAAPHMQLVYGIRRAAETIAGGPPEKA